MKKIISIILAFVMMFLAAAAVFANSPENDVEIIFSENFEGDLSRWQAKYNGASIIEGYKEEEYISHSLCVRSRGFDLFSDDIGYLKIVKSPEIDIISGEQYTVAVDMKGSGSQHGYVYFIDENGVIVNNEKYVIPGVGSKDKWACSHIFVKAPETAVKLYITLEGADSKDNNNSSFYDNVIVCKGFVGFSSNWKSRQEYSPKATDNSKTVIEKINPVFYDNFESRIEDWTYPDTKSKTKVKRDKDTNYTGEYSLIVKDDISDKTVGIASPYFDVEGGAEYKLSADIYKNMPIQKTAIVNIVFYSAGNSELSKFSIVGANLQWENYSVTALAPKDAVKANILVESDSGTSTSYIDNIMVIKTKDKPEPDKMAELNKSSIVLFLGSAKALVNGERILIDKTNENVKANSVNGRTLVPVRFIAENFGAEVGWDDATRTVTLTLKNKVVKIVLDKAEIDIDGSITPIDVPAQSIEGRTMLPLRAFVETVMGKKIFWDSRGLIVITDTEMLTIEKDSKIIDKLIEYVK